MMDPEVIAKIVFQLNERCDHARTELEESRTILAFLGQFEEESELHEALEGLREVEHSVMQLQATLIRELGKLLNTIERERR